MSHLLVKYWDTFTRESQPHQPPHPRKQARPGVNNLVRAQTVPDRREIVVVSRMTDPKVWWESMPKVTKFFFVAMFATTLAGNFGLVNVMNLLYFWRPVWDNFQVRPQCLGRLEMCERMRNGVEAVVRKILSGRQKTDENERNEVCKGPSPHATA